MIRRLHGALLRGAACLAPAPERAEWLAEWRAELCYVPSGSRTSFCPGAFRDAFWLRRHATVRPVYLQSPWRCLMALAALAAVSIFFALRIPLVREIFFSPDPQGVSIISGISAADYLQLPGDRSFYGPARWSGSGLPVALGSRNLFELLGTHVPATADSPLVLTRTAWRKYFSSDPHIVGRRLIVAGRPAQVATVVSDGVWRLPGRAEAWLLVDDASLVSESTGHVVARVNWSVRRIGRFRCVPLGGRRAVLSFLLMMLAAAVVLPTVTSLSLGANPAGLPALFLAIKIALVLPIALFGSLDLLSLAALGLLPHAVIVSTVIGLRWVLVDQRSRCPVCLRILGSPTSIGEPSRTLLEWYGTELVCGRGHGLLHVPELRNSYSEARWLHLDSSWSSLFVGGRTR
jgi:hypothetical protein